MSPLTISKDKVAVLLRIPRQAAKVLDDMARKAGDGMTRTGIIYRWLATHPRLKKPMEKL